MTTSSNSAVLAVFASAGIAFGSQACSQRPTPASPMNDDNVLHRRPRVAIVLALDEVGGEDGTFLRGVRLGCCADSQPQIDFKVLDTAEYDDPSELRASLSHLRPDVVIVGTGAPSLIEASESPVISVADTVSGDIVLAQDSATIARCAVAAASMLGKSQTFGVISFTSHKFDGVHAATLEALQGKHVAVELRVPDVDVDILSAVHALIMANVDTLLLFNKPVSGFMVMLAARNLGFHGKIVGGPWWADSRMTHGPMAARAGVATVKPFSSRDPRAAAFVSTYNAVFHSEPDEHSALGFDAIKVAQAIARNGDAESLEDVVEHTQLVTGDVAADRNVGLVLTMASKHDERFVGRLLGCGR